MSRMRIDRLLVERGLFESRAKAQAAIAAGRVSVGGIVVTKASEEAAADAVLHAEAAHPYVSRGGVKLAAALDHFGFDPAACVCLDVGASTGGFTQVLLTRGARLVFALDSGREQLHSKLRTDPRVVSIEGVDIRGPVDTLLKQDGISERPDFACVDVSFISLKKVLPPALALVRFPASLISLIKPQFEAGRRALKKGIVRDESAQRAVCAEIAALVRSLGWEVCGIMPSPIAGRDGNREFLLAASRD
jgi:23S rRNA (cytidine1920-2'-O)/16S rRNA (cytidine1409-2'-O)-methyltransferase